MMFNSRAVRSFCLSRRTGDRSLRHEPGRPVEPAKGIGKFIGSPPKPASIGSDGAYPKGQPQFKGVSTKEQLTKSF